MATTNKERLAKRRATDSPEEKKAKSMQSAFRQGTGRTLTLAEARKLITDPPSCPYCKTVIPWKDLSIDHKQPISRGGTGSPENIVWVDLNCNVMKGNLTAEEFTQLMDFLDDKPTIKRFLSIRLRAAGGFMYGKGRKWQLASI